MNKGNVKKNVLITGAAGYIGSKFCQLYGDTYNIAAVDNLMYGQGPLVYNVLPKENIYNLEYQEFGDTFKKLLDWADVVIHLAAIVGAPACDKNKDYATKVNYEGVKAIVEHLNGIDKKPLLIFPNTNSGYGSATGICTEETPLTPISLYGNLKDNAEREVMKYKNSVCFRLATVFGVSPRHRLDLLVNTMVYEAMSGKVDLYDDAFMRNYIHIADICRAYVFAIENPHLMRGGVYNLGNDEINMSKGDLAKKIGQHLFFSLNKIGETDPDKRDYVVSSQKLYNIGWRPTRDLDYGIIELMNYYDTFPRFGDRRRTFITQFMRNVDRND